MFSSLHHFRFRSQKKLVASTGSHINGYFEGIHFACFVFFLESRLIKPNPESMKYHFGDTSQSRIKFSKFFCSFTQNCVGLICYFRQISSLLTKKTKFWKQKILSLVTKRSWNLNLIKFIDSSLKFSYGFICYFCLNPI